MPHLAAALIALTIASANTTPPSTPEAGIVACPHYAAWAKFKPGSSVRHVATHEDAPDQPITFTTSTLKSVTAEKAVLTIITNKPDGDRAEPTEVEQPRLIEAVYLDPISFTLNRPDADRATAELVVDGKAIACTAYTIDVMAEGLHITGRVWWSDAVPGGLVKSIIKADDDDAFTLTAVKIHVPE